MKNIFLLVGLTLMTAVVSAQSFPSQALTNADTATFTLRALKPTPAISFQLVLTKVSGTVAGNALVQASNDNINFNTISTDLVADTVTLTNGSASYLFDCKESKYNYYRLRVITTGTQASTAQAFYYAKPQNE